MNGNDLRSQFDAEFDMDNDVGPSDAGFCDSYTCNPCCY